MSIHIAMIWNIITQLKLNTTKLYLLLIPIFFTGCTNSILYHPPKVEHNLSRVLPQTFHYEIKSIKTTDGETLSAVEYYTPKKENKGVVLFLHGNADSISLSSRTTFPFIDMGYDVLLLDYRGYGKSTGSPSPKGLNLDIQATVNYLIKEFDNIYIYGQSIGGTSLLGALDEIDRSKIRAIATEGSFLSYKQLSDAVGISVPFANYKELKSYAPFSSDGNTTIPLMLIHSTEDETIPYSQGLALSKHFKSSKHIQTTGRHLGYFNFLTNYKAVFKFFDENKNYQFVPTFKPIISAEDNNISEGNITEGVKE